ncbi:cation diffusion facilitator family transporter [Caldimonas thermodepolymerans]|uniref:cation diffusion facilitator family transporter n=1 Tax=Caldimonas thermodepolymerans TaxID=215580 RepID=UPI002235488F|nr:cation diffusion facilitator family transporter [Caldimonas thermodepolymerans]UZG43867.1 cation diffusion facilitator family transporter [Caldimonas thermodepolymerans]
MPVTGYLKLSVAAAVATILLKTLAWWLTGSVGLLSDAMESFVNLAAAVFALAMVTIARSPADASHPFGHEKAEYFSSGFEGLLILGAAGAIIWAAIERLLAQQPLQTLGLGVALSMLSSLINGGVAWLLLRAARRHGSIALEADGRHLMTDVWTSIGVAAGVLLVGPTGWLWLDPVLAIAVALNIMREAWSLLRRSVDGLMDRALEADDLAAIEQVLQSHSDARVHFDAVRTRSAAGAKYCALHMHVPGSWTLVQAAQRRAEVERALVAAVSGLRVAIELLPVHVEPVAPQVAQ